VLKGVDDVKDTVRQAATSTLRMIGKMTVRMSNIEVSPRAVVKRAVDIALPFLLDKGINNEVKDTQMVCMYYAIEIIKVRTPCVPLLPLSAFLTAYRRRCDRACAVQNAGECLRPHVATTVQTFLTAMSAFESAKLSYLQQHADGKSGMHDIGMSGEELEQRRVSAASGSVFGEVLDKCVQQITADNLADTCASVKTTLKAGLGLPTRAGAARFVVSLVNTVGNSMRDHAGPLLKALGNGLKHPSLTVRTEYGKAAAYLCRVAKNGSVRKYVQRLHEMVAQADSGDVGTRKTAGRAMVALVHHANDKVKRYMLEIMPLVFIAMHDPEAEVAEVWQSAWSTLAASPVHSMRLYLKEIVRVDVRWAACRLRVHVCGVSTQAAVVCEQMDSSSWIAKRQAAKAAQTLVNALKQDVAPEGAKLTTKFLAAAVGRPWDGKEDIISALGLLVHHCPSSVDTDASPATDAGEPRAKIAKLKHAIQVESRRTNAPEAYKCAAMEALGRVAGAFLPTVELYETAAGIVYPLLGIASAAAAAGATAGSAAGAGAGAGSSAGGEVRRRRKLHPPPRSKWRNAECWRPRHSKPWPAPGPLPRTSRPPPPRPRPPRRRTVRRCWVLCARAWPQSCGRCAWRRWRFCPSSPRRRLWVSAAWTRPTLPPSWRVRERRRWTS